TALEVEKDLCNLQGLYLLDLKEKLRALEERLYGTTITESPPPPSGSALLPADKADWPDRRSPQDAKPPVFRSRTMPSQPPAQTPLALKAPSAIPEEEVDRHKIPGGEPPDTQRLSPSTVIRSWGAMD